MRNGPFVHRLDGNKTDCWRMKRILLALACTSALLCGCARYDMELTNGMRVMNVHKPVFNKATSEFDYVDAAGIKRHITASRVVQIEPHRKSMFSSSASP